jgi:predicted hydrocarbon binding protein
MSAQSSSSPRHGLRLGRKVIHQLRAALERDTGLQAASYLQEAGFAGGEELYAEFTEWLASTHGVERPADLDARFLNEALSQFFTEQGWGALTAQTLGGTVLALDSTEWAEALDEGRGEFPSCHLTCGLLADFFGRLSDGLVAVMEVECRSRGDARCRFLAGAPETLSALYDRMAQGASYADALGLNSSPSGT